MNGAIRPPENGWRSIGGEIGSRVASFCNGLSPCPPSCVFLQSFSKVETNCDAGWYFMSSLRVQGSRMSWPMPNHVQHDKPPILLAIIGSLLYHRNAIRQSCLNILTSLIPTEIWRPSITTPRRPVGLQELEPIGLAQLAINPEWCLVIAMSRRRQSNLTSRGSSHGALVEFAFTLESCCSLYGRYG